MGDDVSDAVDVDVGDVHVLVAVSFFLRLAPSTT